VGAWGYFEWPTEPPGLSDAEWWRQEAEFACEDDARPSYDEMMAMEDSGYLDSEVVNG
jgi:hypothetical protein